jgi:N-acetylglucosaminyldiphosphoundecaprenol N-acetyl-beta-D-mannosaminyltransferase
MILNKLLQEPSDILKTVTDSIDGQHLLLLTYLNQHCFNIYSTNNEYRKLLDTQFTVFQADEGIFLALKYLFDKKVNKIDATAMNQLILNELVKKKIPLVIVGGNFDKEFIRENCDREKINLVGYQSGYFEDVQSESIIEDLNNFQANVFIIAMGVPEQELLAEKLSQHSINKVIICVGNFFEFYFGTKRRAPAFIQKIGFEWMFRLFTEPQRLWNRYLIGIPVFIYRVLKIKFARKSI